MGAGGEIVLLVDDDQAVRDSLKFALELDGLAVRACKSGAELLEHPDLPRARCVVLDYGTPAMDGFEVLKALTARYVDVPVILITSHLTSFLRSRARAAGVKRVLEKPLLDSELVDAINGILTPR